MLNTAFQLSPEDPILHPADEAPLDAYSRTVASVVDRVGPTVVRAQGAAEEEAHKTAGQIAHAQPPDRD